MLPHARYQQLVRSTFSFFSRRDFPVVTSFLMMLPSLLNQVQVQQNLREVQIYAMKMGSYHKRLSFADRRAHAMAHLPVLRFDSFAKWNQRLTKVLSCTKDNNRRQHLQWILNIDQRRVHHNINENETLLRLVQNMHVSTHFCQYLVNLQ